MGQPSTLAELKARREAALAGGKAPASKAPAGKAPAAGAQGKSKAELMREQLAAAEAAAAQLVQALNEEAAEAEAAAQAAAAAEAEEAAAPDDEEFIPGAGTGGAGEVKRPADARPRKPGRPKAYASELEAVKACLDAVNGLDSERARAVLASAAELV